MVVVVVMLVLVLVVVAGDGDAAEVAVYCDCCLVSSSKEQDGKSKALDAQCISSWGAGG